MNHAIWPLLLALFFALLVNSFASHEVISDFSLSRREKTLWLLILWLLPYAGFVLVHWKLGIHWHWSARGGPGGDVTSGTDGSGGASDACDPGHGGSC